MTNICIIEEMLKNKLSNKRFLHSIAVMNEAEKLAKKYCYNIEYAKIAGLLHDYARDIKKDELNNYIRKYNLDNKYINNIALAHSKIGAILVKEELDINNEEILNAIEYHTTGRENMTLLEKIIYIADMIEPSRKFNDIDELRILAYKNIESACYKSFNLSIKYIIKQNKYLDLDTVIARNYLYEKYFKEELNVRK